jgi:hypothetical protein
MFSNWVGSKDLDINKVKFGSFIWILVAICISPSLKTAHAYLDPGTGSYIVQLVIGFAFGAAYAGKRYLGMVVGKFNKRGDQLKTKLEDDQLDIR